MELDTRQNHCENPSGQRGVLSSSAKCCNFRASHNCIELSEAKLPDLGRRKPVLVSTDEDKSTLRKCHASALLSHWTLPTLACMDGTSTKLLMSSWPRGQGTFSCGWLPYSLTAAQDFLTTPFHDAGPRPTCIPT